MFHSYAAPSMRPATQMLVTRGIRSSSVTRWWESMAIHMTVILILRRRLTPFENHLMFLQHGMTLWKSVDHREDEGKGLLGRDRCVHDK